MVRLSRTTRRFTSFVLVFLMFISLMNIDMPDVNAASQTPISSYSELVSACSTGGNYILDSTISLDASSQLEISASDVVIELGGFDIDLNGGSISVNSSKNLKIQDSYGGKGGIRNGRGSKGGAILNKGTLIIESCELSDNVSEEGGAIYNDGTLTIQEAEIHGNSAEGPNGIGGAIFNNSGSTVTIKDTTIANNNATFWGGAISNNSTMTLENVYISRNKSERSYAGGIYNNGNLSITDTTISANTSDDPGAGIYYKSGAITLSSVVCVSGNLYSNKESNIYFSDTSLRIKDGDNPISSGSEIGISFPTATSYGVFGIINGTDYSEYSDYFVSDDTTKAVEVKTTEEDGNVIELVENNGSVTKVLSITLSANPSTTVFVGESITKIAKTVSPSKATDRSVTWTSDNSSVATISSEGIVTGVGIGRAVITATANDGSGVSATIEIEVTKHQGRNINQAAVIGVAPTTVGGTDGMITGVSSEMEYSIDGTNYISITGNTISNLSPGKYYIRYKETESYFAGNAAQISVPEKTPVLVQRIAVSAVATTLTVGQTTTVSATVTPSDADNKSIIWSSSDTAKAIVNESGVVTAIAAGNVAITATATDGTNVTGSITIRINEASNPSSGGDVQPGNEQPESNQPGSNQPGSNQPGSNQPGSNQPGGNEQPETPVQKLAGAKISSLANTSKGITVKWSKVKGADQYIVQRSTKKTSGYKNIKTVSAKTTSYTDTAVKNKNGTTYYYRIVSVKSGVKGKTPTQKSIMRLTAIKLSSVKKTTGTSVTIKYTKNSKAKGYQIQYSQKKNFTSAKTIKVSNVKILTKKITKLTKGKKYYFRVRAYNGSSYSAWSNIK